MPLTDQQRVFLTTYLGVAPNSGADGQQGPDPSADLKAALDARIKALTPRFREALAGPPPNAVLKERLATLSALRQLGDFTAGMALLDDIEANLGKTQAQPTAEGDSKGWAAAYQGWLAANEKLDGQLNALRQAILSETAYPEFAEQLQDIARVGLNALTGNHRVRLMAAFQVMAGGDIASLQKHGDKALAAISAFRAYLDGNEAVDACEGNPWDVDVAIRDTLYPPLDLLTGILQSTPAPA